MLVCEVSIKLNQDQGYLLLAGCFGWVRNSQLADSPIVFVATTRLRRHPLTRQQRQMNEKG